MNRLLNKIHGFVEKIGKRNFILIMFIFIVLMVTSLYQTFSLYTEYVGMSFIDGVKTYTFILDANNDTNAVNISAGGSKYIDVTVSNKNDSNLLYKLYYSSEKDLSDVNIIYFPDTMCLPNGIIDGNNDCVVKIKVKNNSLDDVSVDFGIKYGFEKGGELKLDENEYSIDINYMKTLFNSANEYIYYKSQEYREKIKKVSFVDYVEEDKSKIVVSWDISKKENNGIIAWLENNEVSGFYDLYIGSDSLIYVDSLQYFFSDMNMLEEIEFDNLDTSLTSNMMFLFAGCSSLNVLDVSGFNTSNVKDMSYMFYDCSNLLNLDLSNFDTSNVVTMNSMFSQCRQLNFLDLSKFDTSNVLDMSYMFYCCENLKKLELGFFDTSSVVSVSSLFSDCVNLTTTITIRNVNTSDYESAFLNSAYVLNGAMILVDYTSETSELIDNMISTKSTESNVIKGSLVE